MSESTPEQQTGEPAAEEFTETINSAHAKKIEEENLENTPDENPGPPENSNPSEAGETLPDSGDDEVIGGTE